MRLHRRPEAWLIVLAALSAGPGSALAQPSRSAPAAASAPDPATVAARAAHEQGLAARKRGDWTAAYAAFLSAWEHKHHWEIAVNLGEAEIQIGKYEEAAEHLAFTLGEPGFLNRSRDLVDEESKQISAWLKDARTHIEARRRAGAPGADSAPPRTWLWIAGAGGGLSALGALSGGILLGMAGGKVGEVNDSLRALPGQTGDPASVRCAGAAAAVCRQNEERLRSADSMQSTGTALLVTAGAVAVATTVVAVLWPDRREGAPVVAPVVSVGSAGLALSAAW